MSRSASDVRGTVHIPLIEIFIVMPDQRSICYDWLYERLSRNTFSYRTWFNILDIMFPESEARLKICIIKPNWIFDLFETESYRIFLTVLLSPHIWCTKSRNQWNERWPKKCNGMYALIDIRYQKKRSTYYLALLKCRYASLLIVNVKLFLKNYLNMIITCTSGYNIY